MHITHSLKLAFLCLTGFWPLLTFDSASQSTKARPLKIKATPTIVTQTSCSLDDQVIATRMRIRINLTNEDDKPVAIPTVLSVITALFHSQEDIDNDKPEFRWECILKMTPSLKKPVLYWPSQWVKTLGPNETTSIEADTAVLFVSPERYEHATSQAHLFQFVINAASDLVDDSELRAAAIRLGISWYEGGSSDFVWGQIERQQQITRCQ